MKAEDHNLQKELSTLIGRRSLTARLPWLSILWLLAKFTCRTWVSCWGTCSATSHRAPRSCHNRMAERGKYRSSEALQPSQPAAPSASRTTCHSFFEIHGLGRKRSWGPKPGSEKIRSRIRRGLNGFLDGSPMVKNLLGSSDAVSSMAISCRGKWCLAERAKGIENELKILVGHRRHWHGRKSIRSNRRLKPRMKIRVPVVSDLALWHMAEHCLKHTFFHCFFEIHVPKDPHRKAVSRQLQTRQNVQLKVCSPNEANGSQAEWDWWSKAKWLIHSEIVENHELPIWI